MPNTLYLYEPEPPEPAWKAGGVVLAHTYQAIAAGTPPAEALRQAQLTHWQQCENQNQTCPPNHATTLTTIGTGL